jgi:hypothetical protein
MVQPFGLLSDTNLGHFALQQSLVTITLRKRTKLSLSSHNNGLVLRAARAALSKRRRVPSSG